MKRLNLGCGPVVVDGWVNADVDGTWSPGPGGPRFVIADPLGDFPFPDDWFDGAVAHHVLQMVAWPDLVPWLVEVRRVLRPGAVLRVSVPDVVEAFDAWRFGQTSWFPIADEHERDVDGKFCMYVTQAGATRSIFTPGHLTDLLDRAGFYPSCPANGDTVGEPWLVDLDSRQTESLFAEGRA